jgi:hypothetical protein
MSVSWSLVCRGVGGASQVQAKSAQLSWWGLLPRPTHALQSEVGGSEFALGQAPCTWEIAPCHAWAYARWKCISKIIRPLFPFPFCLDGFPFSLNEFQ